jgi:hypothetical protein
MAQAPAAGEEDERKAAERPVPKPQVLPPRTEVYAKQVTKE